MAATNIFGQGVGTAFTKEDNDLLTRVGPGTPMGTLFRQYWIPVLPVSHLEEPGGKPRRIRLLGEDLVAFRTWEGTVGVIGAYCAHRLAPLYFGRIEQDGIRCPYHGWKFATDGRCMEMPNVPAQQQFGERIKHPGYPCIEHGGVIWIYMGGSSEIPALPEFEFTMVPDDQRRFRLFHQECNYLQAMEGGIDPTHVMWLHAPYDLGDQVAEEHQATQQRVANESGTRTPLAVEMVETAGGFMYGARRPMPSGKTLWRVNQFIMPFYTMPPGGAFRSGRMWVPIDDEQCIKWMYNWYPTREIMEKTEEPKHYPYEEEYAPDNGEPYGHIRPTAQKSNDYLIDWDLTKMRRLGIAGVNLQDKCIQENEGPTPILDRTKEHLCVGDLTIVKARRLLKEAAVALQRTGAAPVGVRDGSIYRVRAVSTQLPDDVDWIEGVRELVTVPSQVEG
jgi:phthalate 4,5-dioxygenase oxygenase subunit